MINISKLIKIKYIPAYVLILIVSLFFIPINFATTKLKTDKGDYYIVSYVSDGCTDAGMVVLWETSNADYNYEFIILTGSEPKNNVGYNIYNNNTQFVVYGELTDEYTLNVEKWDVYSEVIGGLHKKYLTIFDYPWMNWWYEDNY